MARGSVARATSVATRDGHEREQSRKRTKSCKTNEFGNIEGGLRTNGSKRYDEWVCTQCDKQNFMFQAECRNCKADPTPAEKEQGTWKTEGIPP